MRTLYSLFIHHPAQIRQHGADLIEQIHVISRTFQNGAGRLACLNVKAQGGIAVVQHDPRLSLAIGRLLDPAVHTASVEAIFDIFDRYRRSALPRIKENIIGHELHPPLWMLRLENARRWQETQQFPFAISPTRPARDVEERRSEPCWQRRRAWRCGRE